MSMYLGRLAPWALVPVLAIHLLAPPPSAAAAAGLNVSYEVEGGDLAASLGPVLKESAIFDDLAAGLNEAFAFPTEIPVIFGECGDVNAFYAPEDRVIVMCYELVSWLVELYGSDGDLSEEEAGVMALNSSIFIFLHELGHALVHNMDIPITGKEEDAVDDLAALLLIAVGDEGEAAVFSAIGQFGAVTAGMDEESLANLPFWDEHSLDPQRMFNLACLVYGSDPEKHGDLVAEDLLPSERAVRCPDEFQQKSRSWDRLLERHVRD